jgi:hypothetical protein
MTTIRTATNADTTALDRLAQLDSSVVPAQPILIAEVDGRLVAALSATDGSVIADPFTYTSDSVALLRRRAQGSRKPRALRRPVLRPAH